MFIIKVCSLALNWRTGKLYPNIEVDIYTPGSYRAYPDLPRTLKRRGPVSGSPGRDFGSGSNELKTALSCPSKDLRGPAPGHPGVL